MLEDKGRHVFIRAGEPVGIIGSDAGRCRREPDALVVLPDERWGNPVFGDGCFDDCDFHIHAKLTIDRLAGTGVSLLLGGHFHYSHSRPDGNKTFRICLDEDIIPQARQIFKKDLHIVYGSANPDKHWNLTVASHEKEVAAVSGDFIRAGEPFTIDLSRQGEELIFAINDREVFRTSVSDGRMIAVGRGTDSGWPFSFGFLPGRATLKIHEFHATGTFCQPIFPTTDVWHMNSGGYTHYRIPSLCMLPSGRLLAFTEARRARLSRAWEWEGVRQLTSWLKDEVHCLMKYSDDNGQTWSEPQTLIDRGMSYEARDPSPVFDRDTGELFLFTRGGPWMISSKDEGRTWSEPRWLAESAPGAMGTITPRDDSSGQTIVNTDDRSGGAARFSSGTGNSAIQLRHGQFKGRLLVSLYGSNAVGMIFSDDHGKTWQPGAMVAWSSVSEPSLVELSDGRVLMTPRGGDSPKDERMFVLSTDGGATVAKIYFEPAILIPGRGGELIAIESSDPDASGKVRPIVFCGPAEGGTRLTLKISLDDGVSWPISKVVDDGSAGNMSMVALPNGKLGVLYERDKFRRQSFMHVDLEAILQSATADTVS